MAEHDYTESHILSTYYAPRGRKRIYNLGIKIAQQYLKPDDQLIGIMGDPGSGKSALVKGMFPGLELTNDDNGVNVRPLPILDVEDETGFFTPHTYHLDIRFETGFTQLPVLADAIMAAIRRGKRVVCEHFELIYPLLPINADILIGIGERVTIVRPNIFGPEPQEIYKGIHKSLKYRLMAHTAEDLCERCLGENETARCMHGDIHHGFLMIFKEHAPSIPPTVIEEYVKAKIAQDLPVTYVDEDHVTIGSDSYHCTGPRTHVTHTGQIEGFKLLDHYIYDHLNGEYILVGCVGEDAEETIKKASEVRG